MNDYVISRDRLMRITGNALEDTPGVTPDMALRMIAGMRTAESVLLNGWRSGGCGCLVGTAFPTQVALYSLSPVLVNVGLKFNQLLMAEVGATSDFGIRHIYVTDDEGERRDD